MQRCSRCKAEKSLDSFHNDKQKKSGKRSACKECLSADQRAKNSTPEGKAKAKAERDSPSRRAYQLAWGRTHKGRWKSFRTKIKHKGGFLDDTIENYIKHCDKPNCDVCGVELTAERVDGTMRCVDHCHKTGKIRGALCMKCNSAEGYLKSDIEIIRNLLKYLERTNDGS